MLTLGKPGQDPEDWPCGHGPGRRRRARASVKLRKSRERLLKPQPSVRVFLREKKFYIPSQTDSENKFSRASEVPEARERCGRCVRADSASGACGPDPRGSLAAPPWTLPAPHSPPRTARPALLFTRTKKPRGASCQAPRKPGLPSLLASRQGASACLC